MSFRKQLIQRRRKSGLSQEDVARKLRQPADHLQVGA